MLSSTGSSCLKKTKLLFLFLMLAVVAMFYATGSYHYLELAFIQKNLDAIRSYYESNPGSLIAVFLFLYISITSLSIPGAIVLTLLAGAIFGVIPGTLLVSFASTAGATIAFLMSRYLFRESMMNRFKDRLKTVNQKVRENGNSYLFTMRLIPVSPYVVINVMMGLTSIKTWNYIWITFVAMFPGNLVYVYAGRKISEIKSASEILTWPIILVLTLLGILPWLVKKLKFLAGDQYEPQR